jgi:hypothetical protein
MQSAMNAPAPTCVFLLSPASAHGRRAQFLFREQASFPLAIRVRSGGAPLADVFSFVSGLYFRGKVAYARAFARPPQNVPGALVITSSRGLVDLDAQVTLEDLAEFATVPIAKDSVAFRTALEKTARDLHDRLDASTLVVLLGSVATGKYIDTLIEAFSERLRYPSEFIGRGDMSRGSLMLRCADGGNELTYVPVDDRSRHGPRPPRLEPRRWPRPAW